MDPNSGRIYPSEQIDQLPAKVRGRLVPIPQHALATLEEMGPDARKAWARERVVCVCGHRRGEHSKHGGGKCKAPGRPNDKGVSPRCVCRKFKRSDAGQGFA